MRSSRRASGSSPRYACWAGAKTERAWPCDEARAFDIAGREHRVPRRQERAFLAGRKEPRQGSPITLEGHLDKMSSLWRRATSCISAVRACSSVAPACCSAALAARGLVDLSFSVLHFSPDVFQSRLTFIQLGCFFLFFVLSYCCQIAFRLCCQIAFISFSLSSSN